MYGDWIIAKGSSIGGRHTEGNIPCQDACNVFYDTESKYGIAIVCDGAGSALNSEKGSNFVVNKGVEVLQKRILSINFETFFTFDKKEVDSFFIEVFKELHEELKIFADSINLPVKSLATTIILVLFHKSGLICSHIGDGRAGFQDTNGEWLPMLEPYKGEEANQTVFLTSNIWENPQEFIRTTVVNQTIQSFTLMTDGCENATFQLNKFNDLTQLYERLNNPYPKFFNPNVIVLRNLHSQGKSTCEIDDLWTRYLQNGNEKFQSEIDDKTLILATLKDIIANA